MPTPDTFDVVVLEKDTVAADIVRLTLARPDNGDLPRWEPGAHIDLHVGRSGKLIRQYSLCSSPTDRSHYQVAVLREPTSRGGSSYIVDELRAGDTVPVSLPRNHFDLAPSQRYLFIAGGIGITPILPMIEAAHDAGAEWTLLYGGRTRTSMAFAEELNNTWGPRVLLRPQDEYGLLDLQALLSTPTDDTAVYCCGPSPLLDAIDTACQTWPTGALHMERFAPVSDTPSGEGDTEFEVEFAQSEVTLTIPADRSIVDVADEAGVPIVYSCEEGTCGVCETSVLRGEPDHRDSVLTEQERRSGAKMMICVSRAKSARLVLDA
ncbi:MULTISPECIES: PDR/VanB family oxidoreductase [unclassified Dietzia]|uniref:PDR/VanB family oxidoreductase n=1 Tax=unclassified Dietzia TaxID=2617939 RepID=UPI0015FC2EF9|nr:MULTISPECIES: PDR/VanB family oxidoreductase [unclassified Dietzia]MBB1024184.1 oxidoreductase [Dietzia sp. DQ12-76]MBB1026331.1 oxidoreductase [Dietzia sp. DQ11-38-2]